MIGIIHQQYRFEGIFQFEMLSNGNYPTASDNLLSPTMVKMYNSDEN